MLKTECSHIPSGTQALHPREAGQHAKIIRTFLIPFADFYPEKFDIIPNTIKKTTITNLGEYVCWDWSFPALVVQGLKIPKGKVVPLALARWDVEVVLHLPASGE